MKLIAVEFPYMVSPSSNIVGYHGEFGTVDIPLLCNKCSSEIDTELQKYSQIYGNNIPDEIYNSIPIVNVNVHFNPIYYFCISYREDIYESELYETIALKSCNDEAFQKVWNETRLCPDPGFYEVEDSQLKNTLNLLRDNIHHYIIEGHDEVLHIIAENFTYDILKTT